MKPFKVDQIEMLSVLLNLKYHLANDNMIILDAEDNFNVQTICIDIDKTGTEALHNHIHFKDFFAKQVSESLKNKFISIIMNLLYLRLKRDFPTRKFRIYVEIDDGCFTLRFTQIHGNEENWLNELDFSEKIKSGELYVLGD